MGKVSIVIFLLGTIATLGNCGHERPSSSHAPPPSDCSTIVFDMIDCLSFLVIGSTDTKPDSSCCAGFKSVLEANADCVCVAVKASKSYGYNLNMSRVMSMPSACKTASFGDCGISSAPTPMPGSDLAPANPPQQSPSEPSPPTKAPSPPTKAPPSKKASAPAPSATKGKGGAPHPKVSAPAPAPSKGGASSITTPLVAIISLIFVSLLV